MLQAEGAAVNRNAEFSGGSRHNYKGFLVNKSCYCYAHGIKVFATILHYKLNDENVVMVTSVAAFFIMLTDVQGGNYGKSKV